MQLGYTYLVFPGATHTRFEHSLGVFANTAEYLQALLGRSASPAFRQLVSEEMLDTTLLAALLHDIAQHSFAHTLEDDLNFSRHERAARAFLTGQDIGNFLPEPLANEKPLQSVIEKHWPNVRMDVLLWMVAKDTPPEEDLQPAWRLMRSVIDGPLDADKMDYLLRDAHHAGVEYARSIDVSRLLSSLCGVVELISDAADAECRAELGITWKGQVSAENLSIARFNMFRVLYWHHAVRSAHAMVGRAFGLHLVATGPTGRLSLNHALYTVPIHQISEILDESPVAETKRLGSMLRSRQLFKRLKEYAYKESPQSDEIYKLLSDIREAVGKDDPAFFKFCGEVASDINKHIPGGSTTLEAKHILLDIPKPGKEDSGTIRFIGKDGGPSQTFHTDILEGQAQDWAKYARKIRVFVDPNISKSVCDQVRLVINGAFRRVGSKTLEKQAKRD
jgi:HD superfamily phosphohydrolase